MRGYKQDQQEDMFSYISLEDSVPKNHPLRKIKEFVETILEEMWPDFDGLYSSTGRPGVPPEQLLKALLIQVLFTIRSETQLVEQFDIIYCIGGLLALECLVKFGIVQVFQQTENV